jgi:CBS domain-containing protein
MCYPGRESWRLYLPESWANDPERLAEAGVPEEVKFRKKWELALEMIDQARGWKLTDRIVVADAGYGDVTAFREELEKRKLRYAVGVQSTTGVWVEPPSRPRKLKPKQTGRPPSASHYGKQRPVAVKEAAQQAQGWKKVRWREGSKGWLESRFCAIRVQPSHGFHEGRDPGKEIWLLIEWPEKTAEPTRYFFCDLPADYSLQRLVQVAKARWKIEQDYQQLKEPDSTVYDAIDQMAEKGVGALLVMEGKRLVGIVSERDYARKVILKGKASREIQVREIMSHPVICACLDLTIEQTMALMTDNHVRHLPVLVEETVVGVISIGDVVRAMIEDKEFYIQQLTTYITSVG